MNTSHRDEPERASFISLLRFFGQEAGAIKLRILTASTIAGISRGILLATFNAAAVGAAAAGTNLQLAAVFGLALTVYLLTDLDAALKAERATRTMIQTLRLNLCEKLLHSRLRFVERKGPAKIFANISSDIHVLSRILITFLHSIQAVVVLIFSLCYLAWISLPGLFMAVLAITVAATIYWWQNRPAIVALLSARKKEDAFFDRVYDLVRGYKELKESGARQADLTEDLTTISTEFRELSIAGSARYQIGFSLSQAAMFILIAAIVFVLPSLFPTTSVVVFQFLTTLLFLIGPVERILRSVAPISRAQIALGRVRALEEEIDAESPGLSRLETELAPPSFQRIVLDKTSFCFAEDGEQNPFVLGPIDLEIRRGEILFICGGNGAGKTSLLKLLTGMYEPTSGLILVDGEPIGNHQRQQYRELFATIFSDFYLFSRLYGTRDLDLPYFNKLLSELQIGDKTRLKGNVFSTVDLSSGQRRRLAYAVSRLSDRQVYVFDEFAADQDSAFRQYFYTSLLPELKRSGKTIVVVTHDDRWYATGDRLIKLERGRVVEDAALV